MRRRFLLVLSALILTGGGLSAQSHGRHALKRENPRAKAAQEWVEKMKAGNGKSVMSLLKTESAAKDPEVMIRDRMVSVVPKEPDIAFNLSECDQTQTRKLVVKNISDEPLNAVLVAETQPKLKRKVFGDIVYCLSVIDGYAYGYSEEFDETVQYDIAAGEVVKYLKGFDAVASVGGTMWASCLWNEGDGKYDVVALDENLDFTDFRFETPIEWPYIAADGDNILVYGFDENDLFRAMAYNTNGELVADYGSIEMPTTEILPYNPVTRTFWFGACISGMSVGVQINNGKLEVSDFGVGETEMGMTCYVAFDENGKPYYFNADYSLDSYNAGIYEGEYTTALAFSQRKLNLQPGQQTTIDITANATEGYFDTAIFAFDIDEVLDNGVGFNSILFMRGITVDVGTGIEYEIVGDSVFTAFTGYETIGTLWLKNTGCQSFGLGEPYQSSGTAFWFPDVEESAFIFPSNFSDDYKLHPGDSLGVMLRFYSESPGTFTSTFTFQIEFDGETSNVEVGLKGTAADMDIQIARAEIDTTLTECVDVLTVPNKIVNNTSKPVTVGFDNTVTFSVTTGNYDQEYVIWRLFDANGNLIYYAPYGTYTQTNKTYTTSLALPAGRYKIEMLDWWAGGYINVSQFGEALIAQSTSNGGNTVYFDVANRFRTTIAPGSNIDALQIPASDFNMAGLTKLYVFVEDIDLPVDEIDLTVDGGKGELSVTENLGFGEQVKGTEPEQKLTITNTGCAPVSFIAPIHLKHGDYFEVCNNINSIAPGISVNLGLIFYADSVGPFADTLVLPAEGLGNIEVYLTGTGTARPVTVFDNYLVKDTIDFGTPSVTMSSMVHNDGEGNLVITEPLIFDYNAGNGKHKIYIDTYSEEFDDWYGPDNWLTSNFNGSLYQYSQPGKLKICLHPEGEDVTNSDAYFSIISGNDTIAKKIMVKDVCTSDNWETVQGWGTYVYNLTLTEESFKKYTVAAGDSMPLTMTIATADLPVGSYSFYKYFTSNDLDWDYEIEMDAQILVKGDTAVSVPATLAFGNVQLGTMSKQTFTLTNTGGAKFELDYRISGTGFSFVDALAEEFDWKLAPKQVVELEVDYTPTAIGAATGELKILEYDSEKLLATIALSAAGVAAVEPEYDTLRITAECGQTEVKTAHTITNGSSAPLQYVTKPRLKVYSGAQNHPTTIWLKIFPINTWGEYGDYIVYMPINTYTVSGKTYEQILDLPAGNYAVRLGDSQNYGHSNGGYVSVVVDGESILSYNGSIIDAGYNNNYDYTDYRFTISETESFVVPANGSLTIESTYSLEGLTGGEYTFTKILDRVGTTELTCDTLVTVVTVESKLDYAYNKEKVEFVPVHVGESGYASVVIENTGCETFEFDWVVIGEEAGESNFSSSYDGSSSFEMGESKKLNFYFYAEEPGTYLDTLLVAIFGDMGLVSVDTIPIVAIANTTQVMAVSTPTVSGSYSGGSNIVINVTFDNPIYLEDVDEDNKPSLVMNTGGHAVLVADRDFDGYTLSFAYSVAATDNVKKLAIESIDWNGATLFELATNEEITVAKLPDNTEFAATDIALDNTAPTVAISTSTTETTAATATITVAFSEEVTGFAQSNITLSEGAEISSFTTADNATFVAELSLPHAVVTNISVAANVADLAGHALAVAWTGSIASVHDYDTTIFEPTFDSVGYTMLVCKICKDTTYVDTVPMLEVKIVSVALSNMPKKLNYTEGELIDLTGAKLTVTFNNGTTKVVDLTSAMISGFDAKKTGKQTITVKYVDGGETFTVTFDVTIDAKDTAIDENAAEINIFAINRTIVVETADAFAGEIAVFDVNGRMVAKGLAEGTRTELSMKNTGVYIVRVGNTTQRVVLY